MKRPLLWVIALLIAVAPALADVCRVDCEGGRPTVRLKPDTTENYATECPLHQPSPHQCSHDHTIASATLTRAIVDAQRPLVASIVIAAPDATLEPVALDRSSVEHLHVPPLRSPRVTILRI
jgi:hypothetical protein